MTKNARFSPEVRQRAIRMVLESQDEYGSQWTVIFQHGSCNIHKQHHTPSQNTTLKSRALYFRTSSSLRHSDDLIKSFSGVIPFVFFP